MWLRTVRCLVILILSIFAPPLAAEAQPSAKLPGSGISGTRLGLSRTTSVRRSVISAT